MITIDYMGKRGVTKKTKSDYVIFEQPLIGSDTYFLLFQFSSRILQYI